jgi:hypothetical protein
MYILGWEIDFGHLEAVNLISSQKYSEKQIVSRATKVGKRATEFILYRAIWQ